MESSVVPRTLLDFILIINENIFNMNKRSEIKIPISWIWALDIAEFPQLTFSVNATIAETTQKLGDDARLMMAFDKLKSQQANMQKIRLYVRNQDLTKQIGEQDNKRKRSLTMISQIVKSRLKAHDNLMSEHARVLYNWIFGIAPDLPYYSRNRTTRHINVIIEDTESKEKINEAIDYLNLRDDFDSLIETNGKYEALKLENDLLFVAKNMSSKDKSKLKQEAYGALCNFITTLQTSIEWFGEEQYKELYLALKKTLGDFHTALKMRRKKKSETNPNDETVEKNAKAKTISQDTASYSNSNSATSSDISHQADIASEADNNVNSEVRA